MSVVDIYAEALGAYGKVFNTEQCSSWETVLGGLRDDEVREALAQWQRTIEQDFDGRARGAKFPMPTDLLALAVRRRRETETQATGRFTPCGKCEMGWVRVFSGKSAGGQMIDPKIGALRRCDCWEQFIATRKAA